MNFLESLDIADGYWLILNPMELGIESVPRVCKRCHTINVEYAVKRKKHVSNHGFPSFYTYFFRTKFVCKCNDLDKPYYISLSRTLPADATLSTVQNACQIAFSRMAIRWNLKGREFGYELNLDSYRYDSLDLTEKLNLICKKFGSGLVDDLAAIAQGKKKVSPGYTLQVAMREDISSPVPASPEDYRPIYFNTVNFKFDNVRSDPVYSEEPARCAATVKPVTLVKCKDGSYKRPFCLSGNDVPACKAKEYYIIPVCDEARAMMFRSGYLEPSDISRFNADRDEPKFGIDVIKKAEESAKRGHSAFKPHLTASMLFAKTITAGIDVAASGPFLSCDTIDELRRVYLEGDWRVHGMPECEPAKSDAAKIRKDILLNRRNHGFLCGASVLYGGAKGGRGWRSVDPVNIEVPKTGILYRGKVTIGGYEYDKFKCGNSNFVMMTKDSIKKHFGIDNLITGSDTSNNKRKDSSMSSDSMSSDSMKFDGVIIGISGKIGSGKSTLAANLAGYFVNNGLSSYPFSFGDAVKRSVGAVFSPFFRHFSKGDKLPCGMAFERALQKFGTDICRDIDPDIWIRHLWHDMRVCPSSAKFILIDDVRFRNEFDFVRDMGGILIRMGNEVDKRKGCISECREPDHISELELDSMKDKFDLVVPADLGGPLSELEFVTNRIGELVRDRKKVDTDDVRMLLGDKPRSGSGTLVLPAQWQHLVNGVS